MEKQVARIEELIELEVFSSIDLYFAKTFLKNSSPETQRSNMFLFCYLLAAARHGHLCLHILPEGIFPSPYFLTANTEIKEEIERNILLGVLALPQDLCQEAGFSPLLKPICRYQDFIYLQKNWILETKFLFHLKRIASGTLRLPAASSFTFHPLLSEQQKKAAFLALSSPVCFISGGPGTGKTFTAAEMVKAFLSSLSEDQKKTVLIKIAAPTGKAASHLEKKILGAIDPSIQVECRTLHSLLQIKSKQSSRGKSPALFADLLLIDEASMLDAKLFAKLLESLQEGGRLVFMGDKNQLPPVESGALFADLVDIAEKIFLPGVILNECLRVEKKELIDFANSIIQGETEKVLSSSFVQCYVSSGIHQIREMIWQRCQKFFSSESEDTNQFRILSCIRKGPLGVDQLNEMILQRFLEGKKDDDLFSVPILIKENSEAMQLMNGDVGYLVAKVSSFKKKRFKGSDQAFFSSRIFSALLLPSFEWGYCLSVHKSQGSEYESVIALVPKGSEGFGKEVLYTAVTRAKKQLLLLGEESTISALLSKSSRKASGISQRLKNEATQSSSLSMI
jgi:exodeoxyribonuclease V alpha subunit